MKILKPIIEFCMETLETITFIGSLFIVIYLYIGQPSFVQGASMEPNFHTGERVITSKISYKLETIKRGDVVVIQSPRNPDIQYVKRIIGLSGDKVMVKEGQVYLNDELLQEKYLQVQTPTWEFGEMKEGVGLTVPQDYILVMGDNRPRSSDSREFGPVPISTIIGKVVYRYYPPEQIGSIENPFEK